MKCMSFNIQHGRHFTKGVIDLAHMAKTIADENADLVVLNEVYGKGEGKDFVGQAEEIAKILGYHAFFAPAIDITGHGPYGNALLSRNPMTETEVVAVPEAPRLYKGYYEDRCLAKAVTEIDGKKVTLLGIHFGLQPDEAELCVKTVLEAVEKSPYPVVLMGDFNLTPDSPILDPIREVLTDTDNFYKGECNFTFPTDVPKIKIDYIFVSPELKVEEVKIPAVVAADHLPVTATVTF